MSASEPGRRRTDIVRQLIATGPNANAPARFGPLSRFLRRTIGRTVTFERHHHSEIELALLDVLEQHTTALEQHITALEERVAGAARHLDDVDTRAAVATSIADDVAETVDALGRELRPDREKARFVYDELTSTPYVADPTLLYTTDADGRTTLGYHDGPGASALYVGFEDIFRGPSSLVADRQLVYVELLRNQDPVLELGSGRGEMLGLLKDAGIRAWGVDLDLALVEQARALGVTLECGDALEQLGKEADASLGAVFSAQFVEHIGAELLIELFALARTKLAPDGLFIAEAVNPHSPRALKSFWVDPTHHHPLFPETLLALCRLTGFENAEVMFPLGSGDLDTDRRTCGEYAVIARHRGQT